MDTRLAEAEALPDAVLTEMTTQKDHLRDKMDRLSSHPSVLGVGSTTTIRRLSTMITECKTRSEPLTE